MRASAETLIQKTAAAVFSHLASHQQFNDPSSTSPINTMLPSSLRFRLRAAGLHLGVSAAISAAAAVLMFTCWYPSPFGAIVGATGLFMLLATVDVLLGPALTLVIASPTKPRRELTRDLAVIGLVQLSALGYGLYSAALARPVALAFEIDLFRLISVADIDTTTLAEAPSALQQLSWTGPFVLGVAKPTDPAEQVRTVELALAGIPLATLPRYWRSYDTQRDAAWRAARPVSVLLAKYPQSTKSLAEVATRAGQPVEALRFLPLAAQRSNWVTLIAPPDARVVGHLPFDGFF